MLLGLRTVVYKVPDLPLAKDLVQHYKVLVLEEPRNVGGPIWVATIADPFDNTIGLIENPQFGS